MNLADWKDLKHFNPSENWGDWKLIDVRLILELEKLRDFLNKQIIISAGTQKSHSASSYHYKGLAVDCVIPISGTMSLLDIFFAASRFDFHGIGIYRDWSYNGINAYGLHLDMRQLSDDWNGQHRAHWFSVKLNNEQIYLPMKEEVLRRYNVL